ncbi:MAG TPA: glycosyltransferase [Gemmatimonadaceae bacterium]|jgi:dolichyl-phosphate beta-glucosyltransferase|nr:glycosyltransferase [Gemmatimonadaceae bacterium]
MTYVENLREPQARPVGDGIGNPYLSIIIPTFNGGKELRATLEHLQEFREEVSFSAEIIIVDDCSESSTVEVIRSFAKKNESVRVLHNERNRGKGSAVTKGMLAARGHFRLFVDSDLAYPSSQITKILRALESGSDVVVACRVLPESRYTMSPTFFHYLYTRHLLSRGFNHLSQALLLPGILDTQAGLKGFTCEAAKIVFSRLTLDGFGFDLECLYIARFHGLKVEQTPVDFHYRDEPSTVSLLKHGTEMVADLMRVRRNGARGVYA